MKKEIFYGLFVLTILHSCNSYFTMPDSTLKEKYEIIESYDMSEFDIYTFNICEIINGSVANTDRFIACPDDFFEQSEKEVMNKVEELYFLKSKTSDLIIYMSTFSHKNIRSRRGFLNDPESYKNQFYLKDTEYIYVGKYDAENDMISFDKARKLSSMKWYLNTKLGSGSAGFNVDVINSRTVDTNGDEDININQTFSIPFKFLRRAYKLSSKLKEYPISKLCVVKDKKGKGIHVIFESSDFDKVYRFSNKRIPYHPYEKGK